MPVGQVVVGELGVVGDVRQVLEDLLARAGDRRRDRDRFHGRGLYVGARRRGLRPRPERPGSGGAPVGDPHRVPERGAVRRARAQRRAGLDARGTARTASPRPRRSRCSRRSTAYGGSARSARIGHSLVDSAPQQRQLQICDLPNVLWSWFRTSPTGWKDPARLRCMQRSHARYRIGCRASYDLYRRFDARDMMAWLGWPRPASLQPVTRRCAPMKAWMSGNVAGTGTFRCTDCDYPVSLDAVDELPTCPNCGGTEFVRASLFTTAQTSVVEMAPDVDDHRLARGAARRLERARPVPLLPE